MNRTTLSLIAGTAALAAVTGFAALTAPDAPAAGHRQGGRRAARGAHQPALPGAQHLRPRRDVVHVLHARHQGRGQRRQGRTRRRHAERQPTTDGKGDGARAARRRGKPVLDAQGARQAGHRRHLRRRRARARRHRRGQVRARLDRPGDHRGRRGHAAAACRASTAPPRTPSSGSPGASTAADRTDYVHLTNPDDSAAVVDIELYGKDGALQVHAGARASPSRRTPASRPAVHAHRREAGPNLTVHVNVRSGPRRRRRAGRWTTSSAATGWPRPPDPSGSLVLPGIPKDATSVRLVAFAPGDADADLKVRLASPTGLITPAGHETLHVKAGMTTAVDLGDVTRGEAGSLVLTPTRRGPYPVVAALRVVRGKGDKQETAFIPATAPGRHARHRRRQPRQGHHALPDRPRPGGRQGQGHRLGGQRGRHAGVEDVHGQGGHHPGRRSPPPRPA